MVRLTQGSPPVLLLRLPETTANRLDEETPKRGGAEGGRFTGSLQATSYQIDGLYKRPLNEHFRPKVAVPVCLEDAGKVL